MSLVFTQALVGQGAAMTVGAKFKAVTDFARSLFCQAAALSIFFSGRTNSLLLLYDNLKVLHAEAAFLFRCWLRRANELTSFGLGLHELLRRDIRSIHIQRVGFFQTHGRLLL